VDDESVIRDLLQIALQQQGFVVWAAANGHEAVQLYQRHRQKIALVLLDVRMPGLDGPETLAALRHLDPAVVCCFMTGEAGAFTEAELLQQGAARVFPKPFALAELRAAVCELATPA
jgi:DNA-binding response OmpR family regulator